MLISVGPFITSAVSIRTCARALLPRSACGRYSVLPEGLLGALPGHGQGPGRRLQPHSVLYSEELDSNGPVVVGGAVLDCVIHIDDEGLKLDGRTVGACAGARAAGGVARNVAAALALLGAAPRLLSALGDDAAGRFVLASLPPALDARGVLVQRGARTPVYAALLGARGAVRLGLADMRLHARGLAAPLLLPALRRLLRPATPPAAPPAPPPPLVVADGNAPADAVAGLLELCREEAVPGTILGPLRTPFADRVYCLAIECGPMYPDERPFVRFLTRINMRCVNVSTGEVDAALVPALAKWQRDFTIERVLRDLQRLMSARENSRLMQPEEGATY